MDAIFALFAECLCCTMAVVEPTRPGMQSPDKGVESPLQIRSLKMPETTDKT